MGKSWARKIGKANPASRTRVEGGETGSEQNSALGREGVGMGVGSHIPVHALHSAPNFQLERKENRKLLKKKKRLKAFSQNLT